MSDYKPGDKVRVNGDDTVWTVRRVAGQSITIRCAPDEDYGQNLTVLPRWLTPVTPSLPAVLADAQPGDVVRAGRASWVFDGLAWVTPVAGFSPEVVRRTPADLAALDPNPVRLVPLPSLDDCYRVAAGPGAMLYNWLADRERGRS